MYKEPSIYETKLKEILWEILLLEVCGRRVNTFLHNAEKIALSM